MNEPTRNSSAAQGGIPELLRATARWIRWRLELNPKGKWTKVPDCSTRDATARRTFDEAVEAGPIDAKGGIGFSMTDGVDCTFDRPGSFGGRETLRLFALDLDACRDPVTGALEDWAQAIIHWSGNSYTEVTPSGAGLRVWVLARDFPVQFTRAKVHVPYPAPAGVDKKPELQVFGYGVPQFVTVTGTLLPGCSSNVRAVDNLRWLIEEFDLATSDKPIGERELPQGTGDAPSVDTILATLEHSPHRAAILDADWRELARGRDDESASSAFYMVARLVLKAANGHGRPALEFIQTRTAWGLGAVEDSADPAKYGRASWLAAELRRVAEKMPAATNLAGEFDDDFDADAFEPPPSKPMAAAQDEAAGEGSAILDRWPTGPLTYLDTVPPERKFLLTHPEDEAGALPLSEVGLLSAEGGAGKTTAVVQLAISIATGGRWFNHYRTHQDNPKRVALFLGEETAEEIHRKLYWMTRNLNLTREQLSMVERHVVPIPLASAVVPLLELGEHGNLRSTAHSQAIRTSLGKGDPWGLVVVDPISRFAGVNVEADNIHATRFVQELETFCAAPGAPTTIALAHSSKQARRLGEADARGVTGLTDGARWWGTLQHAGEGGKRATFAVRKSNYTRPSVDVGLVRGEYGVLTAESAAERLTRAAAEAEQDPETLKEERRKALAEARLQQVLERCRLQPGLSKTQIAELCGGRRGDTMALVEKAAALGLVLATREGSRMLYSVPDYLK